MHNATDGSDTRQAPVNLTDRIVIRPLRGISRGGRTWTWFADLRIVAVDASLDEDSQAVAIEEAFAEIRRTTVWTRR